MSFLENVEKTVYIMLILAIISAMAVTAMGATAGIALAIFLDMPLIKMLKTGALMGMLTGGSLGLLLPLAHMFIKINKKK